jgi:hypothetical protein
MKRGKKAQFYLISAVIIIVIILGLASVKNHITVKKEPAKFYELGDTLQLESTYVIENSVYTNGNLKDNIQTYSDLFADYMQQSTHENFILIIVSGDIDADTIDGKVYYRQPAGTITADGYYRPGSSGIKVQNTSCQVIEAESANCSITIRDVTFTNTVPILQDNNFIFVITTSEGLSNYIINNFNERGNGRGRGNGR